METAPELSCIVAPVATLRVEKLRTSEPIIMVAPVEISEVLETDIDHEEVVPQLLSDD